MKKLLYLLPLVLLGLSLTNISLYKDKVDYLLNKNPNAKTADISSALTALSPSYWRMQNYSLSTSANLGNASIGSDTTSTAAAAKPEPLYQGAKFRGFPIAAYFSKSSNSQSSGSTSSVDASGYSILWVGVDGFLVLLTLVIAFVVNRSKNDPVPQQVPPVGPQPLAGDQMPTYPQQQPVGTPPQDGNQPPTGTIVG